MKIWRNSLAYVVVFAFTQSGTMYFLLRVLHWRFFLSAIIAAILAVLLTHWTHRFLERDSAV